MSNLSIGRDFLTVDRNSAQFNGASDIFIGVIGEFLQVHLKGGHADPTPLGMCPVVKVVRFHVPETVLEVKVLGLRVVLVLRNNEHLLHVFWTRG